ncbi:MAG: hypothetical protein AB4041_12985 [Microcystaceae cyanobacterium]
MKLQSSFVIALLTLLGSHNGNLLAQSCLNCWINPQTGQQESLEHIIPRQEPTNETPPVVSEPLSPERERERKEEVSPSSEGEKKDDSSPQPENPPLFDDPIDRLGEETEPQPLPRTQVTPRLGYEEQERRLNQQ